MSDDRPDDDESPAPASEQRRDADLPAAAASDAEQRRWRRVTAAAADAARLSESVEEGVLGESEAVDALAATHGSEPEAFEVARSALGDRDAALTTVEQLREAGDGAGTAELDDARVEVARLEARLAAARRRLAELEESRRTSDRRREAEAGAEAE